MTFPENFTSLSQIYDLDFISQLNSVVFSLSEENYQNSKNQIFNSNIIKSKEALYKLLQTLNTAAFYRAKQIQLYQNLLIDLSTSAKQLFGENFTLKCIITNNYLRLSLINDCGFSISNLIKENFEDHKKSILFYTFFAPEIKKNGMEKVIQFYKLEQYCTELFIKERNDSLNPESLAHSIIFDDVDKFQDICSQNNVDLNSIIHHSFLDSNTFIEQKDLSLIEYSAYYGSLQIFKFLLLNSAKFTDNLPLYAIIGGNYEIIHLIEKNRHIEFNQISIETAVLFHRNELVEYLINNYELKINLNCLFNSIVSQNVDFFKTYFIENNSIDINRNNSMSLLNVIMENKGIEFLNAFAVKYRNDREAIKSISFLSNKAIENGDFFTLKYLIHGKFFQPSVELNHVEKAFKKGYIEIIDLILKETNCSINHFFFDNWTSLHFAARYNNTDLIHYILTKKDVNVNARNKIFIIFFF